MTPIGEDVDTWMSHNEQTFGKPVRRSAAAGIETSVRYCPRKRKEGAYIFLESRVNKSSSCSSRKLNRFVITGDWIEEGDEVVDIM